MNADQYFIPYEKTASTLKSVRKRADQVKALAARTLLEFYWRGQSRADWGIHSSLHRHLAAASGIAVEDVKEAAIAAHERRLVPEAREWIRPSVGARLATVDLLARLQHYGVPTRLIDFTKSHLAALYFAVAENTEVDGRLIVAAARSRFTEGVLDNFDVPWQSGSGSKPVNWNKSLFALPDQADFLRIQRQDGVFITGGTPSSVPKRAIPGVKMLNASEVRTAMSIPLVLHSWKQAEAAARGTKARGRAVTVASALTLRIPASSKRRIRRELESQDISWRWLFPDPEGLRDHSGFA